MPYCLWKSFHPLKSQWLVTGDAPGPHHSVTLGCQGTEGVGGRWWLKPVPTNGSQCCAQPSFVHKGQEGNALPLPVSLPEVNLKVGWIEACYGRRGTSQRTQGLGQQCEGLGRQHGQ